MHESVPILVISKAKKPFEIIPVSLFVFSIIVRLREILIVLYTTRHDKFSAASRFERDLFMQTYVSSFYC